MDEYRKLLKDYVDLNEIERCGKKLTKDQIDKLPDKKIEEYYNNLRLSINQEYCDQASKYIAIATTNLVVNSPIGNPAKEQEIVDSITKNTDYLSDMRYHLAPLMPSTGSRAYVGIAYALAQLARGIDFKLLKSYLPPIFKEGWIPEMPSFLSTKKDLPAPAEVNSQPTEIDDNFFN